MVYIMNIRLLFCHNNKKTTYGTLVHFVENIIKNFMLH